jgi:hypothetical protein
MVTKPKFLSWKKWGAFAAVGAVAGAGLYGVKAQDYRAALALADCLPRIDRERQAYHDYIDQVNDVAESEVEEQKRALREAMRSFSQETLRAIQIVVRSLQPNLSEEQRARMQLPISGELRAFERAFHQARVSRGNGDYGFQGQSCSGWFGHTEVVPQIQRTERVSEPAAGVRLFDDDLPYRCNGPTGPSFVERMTGIKRIITANEAKIVACTFRNLSGLDGYVHVRTCSSVNLLNPWHTPADRQELLIEGDTAETALFHVEAIHQVDRDYPNGALPYRMSESAWIHNRLSTDRNFVNRGCAAALERPDYAHRGARPVESMRGEQPAEGDSSATDSEPTEISPSESEQVVDDEKIALPPPVSAQ